MTQRPVFPLGSPGCRDRWCWHLIRWHQHSSPCQSGSAGRQRYPAQDILGYKKSFSLGIPAKLQLDFHKAGADGTQEKPRPGLGSFWLFFHSCPPPHVFSCLDHQHQKESSQVRVPLADTCSSTTQHQCRLAWAMPLLWDTIWEETGFSALLTVLCVFSPTSI